MKSNKESLIEIRKVVRETLKEGYGNVYLSKSDFGEIDLDNTFEDINIDIKPINCDDDSFQGNVRVDDDNIKITYCNGNEEQKEYLIKKGKLELLTIHGLILQDEMDDVIKLL
jgi:hypothetical protein